MEDPGGYECTEPRLYLYLAYLQDSSIFIF
jgi:hypothetical protein